jgi:hypothetical protein
VLRVRVKRVVNVKVQRMTNERVECEERGSSLNVRVMRMPNMRAVNVREFNE